MANEEHLAILKQGVKVWNRWREENPSILPDLSTAYISRVDLSEANLSGAKLFEANLSQTNLNLADLRGAHLDRADLSRANLSGADLSGTNLSEANLYRADLSSAKFDGLYIHFVSDDADGLFHVGYFSLAGADLTETTLGYSVLADLDLSNVKGLETVRHVGPLTIGIDTIYRSRGQIPEAFLRGAGVPENFIAYMVSLIGKAFEYYSCFISYSHRDEAFAQRLHADLQDKGVRCWFAPEDVKGGEKLYDQIDQAIRLHDKLLLVLSQHSIHSEWVMTEIRRARQAELRDGRRKLFPIRLVDWETIRDWECFDADTGKDLAVEVREYFVPDFSHWQDHDSYQQAFIHLLRDLKASEA
jgi:hypothetical protein